MRRVVVTGIGIVSCIGNRKKEVIENLKKLYQEKIDGRGKGNQSPVIV